MSRTARPRRTGAALAAGAALATLLLSGCGAGQIAQTASQVNNSGGADAAAGAILVRDAEIEFGEEVEGGAVYPRGASAPLRMRIVNSGLEPDRLVSASSPVATSVEIGGQSDVPPGQALVIEGGGTAPASTTPTTAPPATPSGTPSPTPTGAPATTLPATPPATPSATGAPGSAEAPATPLAPTPAAPETGLGAVEGSGSIVLTGLREDVRAGLNYELVLVFERAGEVRLQVPVASPTEPREDEPGEPGE